MGLTAKDSGGSDFVPAPEGTHPAVCTAVIDLGTQYSEKWKKSQHRVLLGWELECDARADGGPQMAWRRYTMSLHKKAELRKILEAWRGRQFTDAELEGFDLRNILGKGCLITITHTERDGNTYANIASVSALPKKIPAPNPSKAPILFDIDDPDMSAFADFGEKLQAVIVSSDEWRARASGGIGDTAEPEPPPPGDDDIPF